MAAGADAILRFRENGGGVDEKAATLDGWPVVILTTIGAKTGKHPPTRRSR